MIPKGFPDSMLNTTQQKYKHLHNHLQTCKSSLDASQLMVNGYILSCLTDKSYGRTLAICI